MSKDQKSDRPARGKRETHTLLKPHKHGGRERPVGDVIHLFPDQAERLRKEEKIK